MPPDRHILFFNVQIVVQALVSTKAKYFTYLSFFRNLKKSYFPHNLEGRCDVHVCTLKTYPYELSKHG